MRIMCILSLLVGSFIGIAGLYKGSDLIGLTALCSVFVTAAFGGKAFQKVVEARSNKDA